MLRVQSYFIQCALHHAHLERAMTMKYWAVMPGSSGPPTWTLMNCRIEKAERAADACQLAFGRNNPDNTPLAKYDIGRYLAKDLGTRVSVIQSDKKRVALLRDKNGWVDPYEYRKTKDYNPDPDYHDMEKGWKR